MECIKSDYLKAQSEILTNYKNEYEVDCDFLKNIFPLNGNYTNDQRSNLIALWENENRKKRDQVKDLESILRKFVLKNQNKIIYRDDTTNYIYHFIDNMKMEEATAEDDLQKALKDAERAKKYSSLYELINDKRASKLLKEVYIANDFLSENGYIVAITEPDELNYKYLNGTPSQFKHFIEIIEHGLNKLAIKIGKNDFYIKMFSNRIGYYTFSYDAKAKQPFKLEFKADEKPTKKYIKLSAFY